MKNKFLLEMSSRGYINQCTDFSQLERICNKQSISAYIGSLGAALATMVANLSSHKRGWDNQWDKFSGFAETGQQHILELEKLVDKDTEAFNSIINAFRLPENSTQEKKLKKDTIQNATLNAIEIPLKIMKESLLLMDLIEEMAKSGNPNSRINV